MIPNTFSHHPNACDLSSGGKEVCGLMVILKINEYNRAGNLFILFTEPSPRTVQTKKNQAEITSSNESVSERLSTLGPPGMHPAGVSVLRVGAFGESNFCLLDTKPSWITGQGLRLDRKGGKNSKKEIKTSDKSQTVVSNKDRLGVMFGS